MSEKDAKGSKDDEFAALDVDSAADTAKKLSEIGPIKALFTPTAKALGDYLGERVRDAVEQWRQKRHEDLKARQAAMQTRAERHETNPIAAIENKTLDEVEEEQKEREQINSLWRDVIKKDVMSSVLGLTMPAPVVRQVIGTIFSNPVVRHDLRVSFTLERLPDGYEKWYEKCLLLRIDTSYELDNITGSLVDFPIELKHPLPPYPSVRLDNLVDVQSVSLQDVKLSEEKISDGLVSEDGYLKIFKWIRRIEPGKKFRVATSHTIVKEISDTELWTSLLPSTSIEIAVDVRVPDHTWDLANRTIGAMRALDGPIQGPYCERRISFRSEEALLPNHGVLLWWRPARESSD